MRTFFVQTLGCKVNQYESRQLRQLLEHSGLVSAAEPSCADLAIVNTCCITHVASSKSRRSIRQAKNKNPNALVIVTGCLPAGQAHELGDLDRNCLIVENKEQLPVILNQILNARNKSHWHIHSSKPSNHSEIKDKSPAVQDKPPTDPLEITVKTDTLGLLESYDGQCRAFLKVQDGCDAYCTYCIIPRIRKKVCNKSVKNILHEARSLIAAGHREIVLTGIFLGAYGQTTSRRRQWDRSRRDSLAEMVAQVADLPGLARLRLSSLEPADVTDRLLDVFRTYPAVVPHLHLPLQSGSGQILKKMARQYTIEQFVDVVQRTKAALDRPAITTDIIVGFPGETEADFQETIQLAQQSGFAKIHVFSFSPRQNTPAADFEPKVPAPVIRDRSSRLQALDRQLQAEFRRQFIGQPVEVIVESTRPPKGRCQRYFMVDLSGLPNADKLETGQLVRVILSE